MREHSSAREAARRRLRRVSGLIVVASLIAVALLTYVAEQTMRSTAAPAAATYGYLNRSTGAVALVLLTIVVVLGVLNVSHLTTPRWPGFVIYRLHRGVALLAVCFVTLHVLSTVLNGYAPISLLYAVVPIHSAYRTVWLGVGAVGFDLIVAVLVTSLLRARLGYRAWRAIHWLTYACWAISLAHTLGLGNDLLEGHVWMIVLTWICVGGAVAAVAVRVGWAMQRGRARTLPRIAVSAPELVGLPVVDVGVGRHHNGDAPDAGARPGQLRQGGGGARRVRDGGQP
jgi:predicted ferric reductase